MEIGSVDNSRKVYSGGDEVGSQLEESLEFEAEACSKHKQPSCE